MAGSFSIESESLFGRLLVEQGMARAEQVGWVNSWGGPLQGRSAPGREGYSWPERRGALRAFSLAEGFFVKLRASHDDWHRCEEMGLLARIWSGQGRRAEAERLLLDCLSRVAEQSKKARGSDRKRFEDSFQDHRRTYLELFPETGEAYLARRGLPKTSVAEQEPPPEPDGHPLR